MNSQTIDTELNKQERKDLSKKYESIRNKLFLVEIGLTFALLVLILVGGNGGVSGRLSGLIAAFIPNIWLANALYVVIINLGYTLFLLPSGFYEGYILEHKFNLSSQSIPDWLKNTLKSFAVSMVMSLIIIEITYFILRQAGMNWWIWAGAFWILFNVILNHIAPIILIPIFFKVIPLKNTELTDKLIALAKKAGSKVLGVFEIDFSKKTKKANAAFTGMGRTKRILLADTLLQNFTNEEIEVILAHELGHFRYKHLWQLLFVNVLSTFFALRIGSKILLSSVTKMGFAGISDIGAFPVLALVLFGFMLLVMPLGSCFSRMLERQADRFSIELTNNPQGFIDSMKKLAYQNLSDTNPNPVIHFLLHSHPSINERIKMAEGYLCKK